MYYSSSNWIHYSAVTSTSPTYNKFQYNLTPSNACATVSAATSLLYFVQIPNVKIVSISRFDRVEDWDVFYYDLIKKRYCFGELKMREGCYVNKKEQAIEKKKIKSAREYWRKYEIECNVFYFFHESLRFAKACLTELSEEDLNSFELRNKKRNISPINGCEHTPNIIYTIPAERMDWSDVENVITNEQARTFLNSMYKK